MDWTSSMKQTFEFYEVDPNTWYDIRKIDTIISCSINSDSSSETFYSASFSATDIPDEIYIRVYLVASQNGEVQKKALGTFLVQSPSYSYNGVYSAISLTGYSPLIELKEKLPNLGFTIRKGENMYDIAIAQMGSNMRAPIIGESSLDIDQECKKPITAESNDNWLTYISYVISKVNRYIKLDGLGRAYTEERVQFEKMQPKMVFDDGNSSILLPDITDDRDWYGIPNVVEVYYGAGLKVTVENTDISSPTSIQNRGRRIVYRDTDPKLITEPNRERLEEYARSLLKSLSSVEHKVSFSHGYCESKVGDCVLLNYERAGLSNIKAIITEQEINCEVGCTVNETAVYTTSLWSPDNDYSV